MRSRLVQQRIDKFEVCTNACEWRGDEAQGFDRDLNHEGERVNREPQSDQPEAEPLRSNQYSTTTPHPRQPGTSTFWHSSLCHCLSNLFSKLFKLPIHMLWGAVGCVYLHRNGGMLWDVSMGLLKWCMASVQKPTVQECGWLKDNSTSLGWLWIAVEVPSSITSCVEAREIPFPTSSHICLRLL